MSRSFVAGASEQTVGDALARLGETEGAVRDGRVFVARRRVADAREPLRPGDEVVVHPPQVLPEVRVLSEWRGLHAVLKPPGLPTEPDRRGGVSLVRATAAALGAREDELHAATRLDAKVSGVVVVARGTAAKRLVARLQQEGALERRYFGIAAGRAEPPGGVWDAPIGKDARGQPCAFGRAPEPASTRYRELATAAPSSETYSALEFMPVTGRTHQIRVHAASGGVPLLGDFAHGGPRRLALADGTIVPLPRVALHAERVRVALAGEIAWEARAPLHPDLAELWVILGGAAGAFDEAIGIPIR